MVIVRVIPITEKGRAAIVQGVSDSQKRTIQERLLMKGARGVGVEECRFTQEGEELHLHITGGHLEQALAYGLKKTVGRKIAKVVQKNIMGPNGAEKDDYKVRLR